MTQPIDLVLDGTPGDEAIVINGTRLTLKTDDYPTLSRVFYRLCDLRDELVARRGWERDVARHLDDLPRAPRSRG